MGRKMIRAFLKRGGAIAIVFLAMACVAIWVWWSEGAVGRDFAKAEALTGTVSRLHTERRLSQNSTYSTTYFVTVISPRGVLREDVSGRFYNTLSEGQQIEIRHLPGPPERFEVEPGGTSSNALAALILGALLGLAGGALAWFVWRDISQARHLQGDGLPAEAEIVAQVNSAMAQKLRIRFVTATGAEQTVMLPVPHLKDFGAQEPGARHMLRYEAENPENARFQAMLDWLLPRR